MTIKDHKEKHAGDHRPDHAEARPTAKAPAVAASQGGAKKRPLPLWMRNVIEEKLQEKLGVPLRSDKPAKS